MSHPLRIRRANMRANLPPGAILVTKPSRWGNPFAHAKMTPEQRAEAVRRYEVEHLPSRPDLLAQLPSLRGRLLACYCPLDEPCHADVLARLANDDS
jgi:Domain of unknown function (DUF4326)